MMKESSKIIADEHRKLTLELMKTQTMLVESTCQVSDAVKDTFQFSLQDITDAVTETLKKHAEETVKLVATKLEEQNTYLLDAQQNAIKKQVENHEALAVIDEKLSERILTKQIKLVKGLEQVSTAVEKASETLAASQEKLITSMVKMTEVITQMSQGMGKLIQSSEALKKSQ